MKDLWMALLLGIIIISALYGGIGWNQVNYRTKVIAIIYDADHCQECRTYQHKLHKVKWLFNQKPIVFFRYDKTNSQTQKLSLKAIQDNNLSDLRLAQDLLGWIVLYNKKTYKEITKIPLSMNLQEIEKEIQKIVDNPSISL